MLRALSIETEYRSGQDNLVEDFYRPCLQNSILYDRAVGYFRSSVVIVYGRAIIDFARSGGKIRLICSTDVTDEDAQATIHAEAPADATLVASLLRELEFLVADSRAQNQLRLVATLVALGVLEIRIACPEVGSGLFHEKLGIFVDDTGDSVSFKGSSNETWSGWHPLGNIESNEVFCSWRESEALRVKRHTDYFNRLWDGHISAIKVVPIPEAVQKRLLKHRETSLDEIERRLARTTKGTPNIVLRPHQEQALQSWEAAGKTGILEHATGSGKTITALFAIKAHLDMDLPALVLVPSQILVQQWHDEAKKILNAVVILCAGAGHSSWRRGTRLRSMTGNVRSAGPRLVISTMQTAATHDFRARLSGGEHLLVVADEVHQIGAPETSKALQIAAGPKLGLSATPKRYGDPAGTQRIKDYFGETLEPVFTLRDAINSKVLCEYRYYPRLVSLNDEESDEWEKLTIQIGREIGGGSASDTKLGGLSEKARMLLIRRSRIAKKAAAKTELSVDVVRDNYEQGQRWLVYCEDIDQLRSIVKLISEIIPECSEYHSQMTADKEATLEWFENSGGVLVSIACLDEGVDIPAASHALILASSQNPRQFVQRRGRVLRKSSGKHFADIHDALVVPVSASTQPRQASLLEAEFARAMEFARDAMNPSALVTLRRAAASAGVDPDAVLDVGMED